MAGLSVAARTKLWRGLMRFWSKYRRPVGLSKYDLYDPSTNTGAIADADDWLDSAEGGAAPSTSHNSALSDPFGSNATLLMKGELLMIITAARTAITAGLPDPAEYVRRILGVEVD